LNGDNKSEDDECPKGRTGGRGGREGGEEGRRGGREGRREGEGGKQNLKETYTIPRYSRPIHCSEIMWQKKLASTYYSGQTKRRCWTGKETEKTVCVTDSN
jgi:hypothetical protein